jgi:hypothetical protein
MPKRWIPSLLLFVFGSAALVSAQTDGGGVSQQEIQRRFELLEARIQQLEGELAALKGEQPEKTVAAQALGQPAATLVATESREPEAPAELPMAEVIPTVGTRSADLYSTETRMPVSGYMDFHFNKPESEPGIADFHRFVLLFGHSFNDRIQFWSELELEHALVSSEEPSGEIELEQAYLDFLIKPWLNARSGIMLTPVGLINERHEPPSFNGVERPFVDTVIIPTTWFGPGAGIHGDLGNGFIYKAYLMDTLDSSRFNAETGFRDGRQKAFKSVMQNPAYTGRLEYHGLPGSSLAASVWTGKTGFATPGINPRVEIFEFDGRSSFGRFDFRGQFALTNMDKTAELNALLQRTSGVNPNIAERMRGYYFEGAFHLLPFDWAHDFVVFSRYENFDTQNRMAPGFQPLKEFDRDAVVTGFTYFPEPDVALKFDYSFLRNQSRFIQARNSLNLGLGWWF